MFKKLKHLNKLEKVIVAFLSIVVLVSGFRVGNAFYKENSSITPTRGGIYTEGTVGNVGLINPLFVQYGSITHDLTQLIFSGLTKYDAKTSTIVPDLADFKVSSNGKTYTFVIKENAQWHDGTSVTSNDVIFTYNTVIKSPDFNGLILNYNDYSKTKIIKVDNRTVQFVLEESDSFFLVKTLPGIIPEHILSYIPVKNLDKAAFNKMPIGTGPYKFVSATSMQSVENGVEVNMKSSDNYYGEKPNIPTLQFKIFPTYEDLLKKQSGLDGIRNIPYEYTDEILQKKKLSIIKYNLPQYVAVFINTQADKLKNNKVRLALQLGTDKKALVEKMKQDKIIDTPLLEINQKNWVYQHSTNKANGALFEAGWEIPNKINIESAATNPSAPKLTDSKAKPDPQYITGPNGGNDWKTSDTTVTITGTAPDKTKSIIINDYKLQKFKEGDKNWSYIASFDFQNLKEGENIYNLSIIDSSSQKKLIDSITITQASSDSFAKEEKEKLSEENKKATVLPIRKNKKGEELVLKLIVPETPKEYGIIASVLKEQWQKIGVHIDIKMLKSDDFKKALLKRDYDLLIFGQNLGYNLDAYPYWHSTQAKEGGYNLSQFKNFAVDSLLDKARTQSNIADRKKTLSNIQEIISTEIPAVFLYSPIYYFALSEKIQNTTFKNLSATSDRFARIEEWYASVDRKLNKGVSPFSFIKWIGQQF